MSEKAEIRIDIEAARALVHWKSLFADELAGLRRIMRDREGVGPLASAEYLRTLKSQFRLLEGHRRLSFLNGLRQRGKALPQHEVWLARKIG